MISASNGRPAPYTQQLHSIRYLSIIALSVPLPLLTLTPPLHKSAEYTKLLFRLKGVTVIVWR